MKGITRRLWIELNGEELGTNEATGEQEKQISGIVRVDEWHAGKSVIDTPDNQGENEFYYSKHVFGMRSVGTDYAYFTDREREIIQAIANGYFDGKTQEAGTVVFWSLENFICFNIVDKNTYKVLVDANGRLFSFDTEEQANEYLDSLANKDKYYVQKAIVDARTH